MLDKIYAIDQLILSKSNSKLVYWILLNRHDLSTIDYPRLWGLSTGSFNHTSSSHLTDNYYYKLRDLPEYPSPSFRQIEADVPRTTSFQLDKETADMLKEPL